MGLSKQKTPFSEPPYNPPRPQMLPNKGAKSNGAVRKVFPNKHPFSHRPIDTGSIGLLHGLCERVRLLRLPSPYPTVFHEHVGCGFDRAPPSVHQSIAIS